MTEPTREEFTHAGMILGNISNDLPDRCAEVESIVRLLDRCHRLLSSHTSGEEWRPIETVPKERGTVLLLANIFHGGLYWAEAARWNGLGWYTPTGNTTRQATHWQPLPAPPNRYKIVRGYFRGGRRTIATGLTLEEAQRWCQDPETSSRTCKKAANVRRTRAKGPWFDGYTKE